MHFRVVEAMIVMPVSFSCRPCIFVSTKNRKYHTLFALYLVNSLIVQSCYFVHCLHLPRCLYSTQCHHSMSSFSPLPYLHYLLHHLHRCIIFLLIFRTVFIIIVLTSITVITPLLMYSPVSICSLSSSLSLFCTSSTPISFPLSTSLSSYSLVLY